MEKKVTSTLTKGVIISLIVIIINIVGHYANIILESWFGWVGLIILFGAIIWAVLSYGKQMNDNATFGNLFAHGFKVSATIACLSFVYALLSVYVLFPDFINQVVDKAIEQARKEGKATEEQLQQGIALIRKISTITLFAASILGTLVVGVVASLIGAAIAKKNPQSPFENQS